MMKDISLAKTGATGEKLYFKVQDFVYDDVLFQYCQHPKVNTILVSLLIFTNFTLLLSFLDSRLY